MFSRQYESDKPKLALGYLNEALASTESKEGEKPLFQDKEVVLMLGERGSGKSAFVNYMTGCKLLYKEERGHTFLVPETGSSELSKMAPEINQTIQTELPCLVPSERDFSFLDCGGFDGSFRQYWVEASIVATLRNLAAFEKIKQIRGIVITINFNDVIRGSIPTGLDSLLTYLNELFVNFKSHASSILFVVTHAPKEYEVQNVVQKIKNLSSSPLIDILIKISAKLLLTMLGNDASNMVIFRPTDVSQKPEILDKIEKLKPILGSPLGVIFRFPLLNQHYINVVESMVYMVKPFNDFMDQYFLELEKANSQQQLVCRVLQSIHKNVKGLQEQDLAKVYAFARRIDFYSEDIKKFVLLYEEYSKLNKNAYLGKGFGLQMFDSGGARDDFVTVSITQDTPSAS